MNDTLPPAEEFTPLGDSCWHGHKEAPDWLFKPAEQIYCHTTSSSLWKRRGSRAQGVLVRENAYRRAIALSISGLNPASLLPAVFKGWERVTRPWQLNADELEATVESPIPRPRLRSACRGLRKTRDGVSPPPRDLSGWRDAGHGWQKHSSSPKWLRKLDTGDEGPAFFYVPMETLWVEMPNGALMCVDAYHSALTAFVALTGSTLRKSCFMAWASQVRIVKEWRKRIQVMEAGLSSEGAEAIDPGEVSPGFPSFGAFLPKESSRNLSHRSRRRSESPMERRGPTGAGRL